MNEIKIIECFFKNIYKYILPKIQLNLIYNEYVLFVKKECLLLLMNFLKNHYKLKYKTLVAITVVDYPTKELRFEVNYFLLSYQLNTRINIKLNVDDLTVINSINSIFNSACWYEREIWDLFGVFFLNNPDLRRILTDYGFEGFPFRKDFPQTGFLQIRYDDDKKKIIYETVEMTQEYRDFYFSHPWFLVK